MKRKEFFICSLVLIFSMLIFAGCGSAASDPGGEPETEATSQTESTSPESTVPDDTEPSQSDTAAPETQPVESNGIDFLLEQMTLREKVGQLFIIRPDALDSMQPSEQVNNASAAGVTNLTGQMADMLRDYPVGGIAMFRKNIVDANQITDFIGSLQSASGIPLFMAIDEEGGIVARLGNHPAFDLTKYESAAAVGKSGNSLDALAMGDTIGAYLRQYGFNMDFAPVADVNTNPENPVIGDRAFSSDANIATQMAHAMADGLKQQNIAPVFKHFPGHGDTAEDSHSGIAISYKTREEMEACEWLPYGSLTNKDCVMVGHIATPNITGDLTPATMSYDVVSGILRQQLGFDGVVITDSLAMGAITNEYGSAEAAISVIEAGCDILLDPQNFQETFDAVVAAVEAGTISEQRIDESVYRILTLKQAYGLLD